MKYSYSSGFVQFYCFPFFVFMSDTFLWNITLKLLEEENIPKQN